MICNTVDGVGRYAVRLVLLGLSGGHEGPSGGSDRHPDIGRRVRSAVVGRPVLRDLHAVAFLQWIWVRVCVIFSDTFSHAAVNASTSCLLFIAVCADILSVPKALRRIGYRILLYRDF